MGDGRDGWLHETCGQVFTVTVKKKILKKSVSTVSNTDIGQLLDFSEKMFNKINENKILVNQIVKNNEIHKNSNSYRKINKYHSLAVGIYNTYLKDRTAYIAEKFPSEKSFSGSTELLLG